MSRASQKDFSGRRDTEFEWQPVEMRAYRRRRNKNVLLIINAFLLSFQFLNRQIYYCIQFAIYGSSQALLHDAVCSAWRNYKLHKNPRASSARNYV